MATTLNVCSFNCKNIKTSITELNDLCTKHDLFFCTKRGVPVLNYQCYPK